MEERNTPQNEGEGAQIPQEPSSSPQSQRQQALAHGSIEQIYTAFRGPLPHPALLAEYERIQPGSADRLLSLVERETAHRQKLRPQSQVSFHNSHSGGGQGSILRAHRCRRVLA